MLTSRQRRVARVVASLPESDGFALAGGAALVATQVVERETRDLDFFGATANDVAALAAAMDSALVEEGLTVAVQVSQAGFVRLEVSDGDDATEVDLGVDARIRPAEQGPLGPMLALEELAADKMLALFGRAQAREAEPGRRPPDGALRCR